jgi:hypothetical protein
MARQSGKRTYISRAVETQVLVASRRRCCLCYYLDGTKTEQKGQIAHLDHDPSNANYPNLVYLCLGHHDDFDSRTSQSKGYTSGEVMEHRDRLYRELGTLEMPSPLSEVRHPLDFSPGVAEDLKRVVQRAKGGLDFLHAPWRLLWQTEEGADLNATKIARKIFMVRWLGTGFGAWSSEDAAWLCV